MTWVEGSWQTWLIDQGLEEVDHGQFNDEERSLLAARVFVQLVPPMNPMQKPMDEPSNAFIWLVLRCSKARAVG